MLPIPPQHNDGEHAADKFPPQGRFNGQDDNQERPGDAGRGDSQSEGQRLYPNGIGPHQLQSHAVLRHAHDGPAEKGPRQHEVNPGNQQNPHHEWNQQPVTDPQHTDGKGFADVARLHEPVIHPEGDDEAHLDEEQQTKEEDQPAQGFDSLPLEKIVIKPVNDHPGEKEKGRKPHADQ